jgi:hypothetical protein
MRTLNLSLEEPAIPKRARIVPLVPMGIGSGQVECLSSFVRRLAGKHGLGVYAFLFRLLPTLIQLGGPASSKVAKNHWLWRKAGLNLSGQAGALIAQLNRVTRFIGLICTTHRPLSAVASEAKASRTHRAWCPRCYRSDLVPYDRLIWVFGDSVCCSRHGIKLVSTCPACAGLQQFHYPGKEIDECQHCGANLSYAQSIPCRSEYELWHSLEMERLIAAGQERPFAKTHLTRARRNIGKLVTLPGFTPVPMGRNLGMGRSTFRCWWNSPRPPTWKILMRTSWLIGSNPLDLVTKNLRLNPKSMRSPKWLHKERRAPRRRKLKEILVLFENSVLNCPERIVTLAHFAEICGISTKHPALRRGAFKRRWGEYREKCRATCRRDSTWRVCESIRKSIVDLQKEGARITNRNIRGRIENPGRITYCRWYRILTGFLRAYRSGRRGVLASRELPKDVAALRGIGT